MAALDETVGADNKLDFVPEDNEADASLFAAECADSPVKKVVTNTNESKLRRYMLTQKTPRPQYPQPVEASQLQPDNTVPNLSYQSRFSCPRNFLTQSVADLWGDR